jgi:DNA polymerase III delta prime subunit
MLSMIYDLSNENINENEVVLKLLFQMLSSGRFPHAVLFEGEDTEEKKALTLAVCSALICRAESRPCHHCVSCKKIFEGIHPDVSVIETEDSLIKVAEIRKLRQEAFVLSNEAACKVFVIFEAEKMNLAAQNALLKILEEPPENVYFILTAENRSLLLDTVLSRIVCFETTTLAPKPGTEDESGAFALEIMQNICEKKELALLFIFSKAFKNKKTATDTLKLLSFYLGGALERKINPKFSCHNVSQKASAIFSVEMLCKFVKNCAELSAMCFGNANLQLLSVAAFGRLCP